MQKQFEPYAQDFPVWANQANGMLQIILWTALREQGIGANIQHYNPVIDEAVKKLFNVPDSWKLIAQMPFGGIAEDNSEEILSMYSEEIPTVQQYANLILTY